MSFKRKVAVTTLAASIAVGAFAGLPLSSKGLAEKLGYDVASAAVVNQTLETRIAQIRAQLTPQGLARVQEARAILDNVYGTATPDNVAIVQPIVDRINEALPSDKQISATDFYGIFAFMLNEPYDTDLAKLEQLRENPQYRDIADTLAANADVSNVTVDDFVLFGDAFEVELVKAINSIVSSGTTNPFDTSASTRETIVNTAITNVLANQTLNLVKIFNHYNIHNDDKALLQNVLNDFDAKLTGTDRDKVKAAAFDLYVAYNKAITPPPVYGGIGGFPSDTTDPTVTDVTNKLDELADQISAATGAEKAALISQAIAAAEAALSEVAVVSASNRVSVSNGTATATLSASDISSAINSIKSIVDALKAAAPGADAQLPSIVLTVDLGTITAGKADTSLASDLLSQAAAAGIDGIKLDMGGFSATLPIGGQFTGAVKFSVDSTGTVPNAISTLAASKVYTFGVTIAGTAVDKFTKPVVVEIPFEDTTGKDKELLTLFRIETDGSLTNVGGSVRGNSIVEARDSFSSYVVVENKVSFKDTDKVASWAGRQIQVVASKGAIEGRASGMFVPQGTVTRAEFAKMLVRALNLESGDASESFSDVNASDWFAPYVAAAVKAGIINGRSATMFAPQATITRAEMATMIARALKVTNNIADVADVNAALKGFSDAASINATLKAGVAVAAGEGLIVGNQGKFMPNATATRAEAAVIIYRAMNRAAK